MTRPSATRPSPIVCLLLRLCLTPRTLSQVRADKIERCDRNDSSEAADPADPTESTDAADPIDPIESTDPTDPTDRREPSLATESAEWVDQSERYDFMPRTLSSPGGAPGW